MSIPTVNTATRYHLIYVPQLQEKGDIPRRILWIMDVEFYNKNITDPRIIKAMGEKITPNPLNFFDCLKLAMDGFWWRSMWMKDATIRINNTTIVNLTYQPDN